MRMRRRSREKGKAIFFSINTVASNEDMVPDHEPQWRAAAASCVMLITESN